MRWRVEKGDVLGWTPSNMVLSVGWGIAVLCTRYRNDSIEFKPKTQKTIIMKVVQ